MNLIRSFWIFVAVIMSSALEIDWGSEAAEAFTSGAVNVRSPTRTIIAKNDPRCCSCNAELDAALSLDAFVSPAMRMCSDQCSLPYRRQRNRMGMRRVQTCTEEEGTGWCGCINSSPIYYDLVCDDVGGVFFSCRSIVGQLGLLKR